MGAAAGFSRRWRRTRAKQKRKSTQRGGNEMGLSCKLFGHKWNGCQCTKCGKTRDEQHEWDGCVCTRCGKNRYEQHKWDGCKCSRCGIVRNEQHKWVICKCSRCGSEMSKDDIEKLSDQFLLTKIAQNENTKRLLRKAAAEKLADQTLAKQVISSIDKEIEDEYNRFLTSDGV